MQVAATTSQAALTDSPRLSATIPNASAPRRATAIHKIFVCVLELLIVSMDVLPRGRKSNQTMFTPKGRQNDAEIIGRILPFRTHTTVRHHQFRIANGFTRRRNSTTPFLLWKGIGMGRRNLSLAGEPAPSGTDLRTRKTRWSKSRPASVSGGRLL